MTIVLPEKKYVAYPKAISEMLQQGWTSSRELEMNIRRWVHLRQIVPTVHHILSRSHFQKQYAEKRRSVDINEQYQADPNFLLFILQQSQESIDMNLIAYQDPTHIYRSESCSASFGVYSNKGYAWRCYLPNNLKFKAPITYLSIWQ
jgi:hypothetical protein